MLTNYKRKTRETGRRAWKDGAPDGLPKIHASVGPKVTISNFVFWW